jgi:hypothetical protein
VGRHRVWGTKPSPLPLFVWRGASWYTQSRLTHCFERGARR